MRFILMGWNDDQWQDASQRAEAHERELLAAVSSALAHVGTQ
jgi:hypothetical protein